MENLNLYEILNLNKNSSIEDVKKSYKNMVKKCHPDKGGSPEEFKKVQLSYEILSNEEKRNKYDRYGMKAFVNEGQNEFNMNDIFEQFGFGGGHGGMFGEMEGGNPFSHMFQNMEGKRKCKDINLNLELLLSDIYLGKNISLDYNKEILCSDCNGLGGKSTTKCSECGGNGIVIQCMQMGPMRIQQQVPCNKCSGKGNVITDKCKKCNGNKVVNKPSKLNFNIEKGCKSNFVLRIENEGNQMKDLKNGDILVNIITKEDNNMTRKDNDIYIKRTISLLDVYNNTNIEFTHLDNKKYDINLKELPQTNNIYMVKDLGIPILNSNRYGNLFITVYIEIPKLNNDQILKLNNILNNNITEEQILKNNQENKYTASLHSKN